jgi:cysteine desulfurase
MNERKTFYFDNNATTRVAPEVVRGHAAVPARVLGQSFQRLQLWQVRRANISRKRAKKSPRCSAADAEGNHFHQLRHGEQQHGHQSALLPPAGKRHIVTTAVEHSAIINHCEAAKAWAVGSLFCRWSPTARF